MNRIWNTHVDTMGKTTLPLEFLRPTALLKSGKITRLSTRFAPFKADLSLAHRDSVFDLGYHIAAQGPLAPRRRPTERPQLVHQGTGALDLGSEHAFTSDSPPPRAQVAGGSPAATPDGRD